MKTTCLAIAFLVSSAAAVARADRSCDALVHTMKTAGTYTPVVYTTAESDGGWVGYSSGWVAPNSYQVVIGDHLSQRFSDRQWNATSNGVNYWHQPFNPAALDQVTFSFNANNDIQMTLNTWGNGTYTIPVTCRGSLATGFTQYGSIIYAYVFSFGPTLPIPG